MASVSVVEHANGDVSIGVEIEGTYVPFASVSRARIGHLQERAASLRERQEADPNDQAVQEAISALPISAKAKDQPAQEDEG